VVNPLRRLSGTVGSVLQVAVGLSVLATTAYLFLIIAGRILGPAQFAGLAALYVVIQTLGNGLYQPLEQEVARRRGHARSTGQVESGLLRRALVSGLCFSGAIIAISLIFHGPAIRLLGGQPQLLAALAVALPGYAVCFVVRGALSGSRRLGRYGLQLSAEGVFRLLALGVLAVAGVRSVTAYGWLFGLAPWVAAACSLVGLGPGSLTGKIGGRPTPARPLVTPLALLLVSTLSAQLLIGAGPLTAQLFSNPSEAAAAGAFLAALVVVRLPVFLFTAVQPSMLPAMAAHVGAGRVAGFRSVLVRVLRLMALVATATFVVTTLLGPLILKILFGPAYGLGTRVFAIMGFSIALFMIAGVLGQAVLALGRHRLVTIGWLVGLAGLVVGVTLASDLVGRALYGLLIGAAAAAVTFAILLWRSLRAWDPSARRAEKDRLAGVSTT
jgi:O-antigen/teichoic acid export membrane protein